jgi:hypothetical protein
MRLLISPMAKLTFSEDCRRPACIQHILVTSWTRLKIFAHEHCTALHCSAMHARMYIINKLLRAKKENLLFVSFQGGAYMLGCCVQGSEFQFVECKSDIHLAYFLHKHSREADKSSICDHFFHGSCRDQATFDVLRHRVHVRFSHVWNIPARPRPL